MDDVIKTAWQVELKGRYVEGSPFYWRSKAVWVDKAEAEKWRDEVIEAQQPNERGLHMVDPDTVVATLIELDVFI